jgi:glycosyltransferase involved in cell wall biosynthesis
MAESRKKRILFILQLPPPLHGASLANNYVSKSEVIRSKFEVDFIDLQFAKTLENITRFSLRKVFISFYYSYKIIERIIIYKPDLIYFTLSPTGLAFYRDAFYVLIFKIFRKKIVFHLHGKGFNRNADRSSILKYLIKLVFNNTSVICVGERLVTDINKIYRSKPYIVPNGIQDREKSNHKTIQNNDLTPRIIYLSNFMREKGILILIDALKILNDQGHKFEARLIGAPTDLSIEYLEEAVRQNKLTEFVQVVGPAYGKKKIIEYDNADIFVFPTYYKNETFGIVNLEAMQSSLPVISTYECGIPDVVIDNETGFLVEPRNAQELAEKIAILLSDKNLRIEMGKKGYERYINNFTLNHFESNLVRTFQAILDN